MRPRLSMRGDGVGVWRIRRYRPVPTMDRNRVHGLKMPDVAPSERRAICTSSSLRLHTSSGGSRLGSAGHRSGRSCHGMVLSRRTENAPTVLSETSRARSYGLCARACHILFGVAVYLHAASLRHGGESRNASKGSGMWRRQGTSYGRSLKTIRTLRLPAGASERRP